MQPHIYEQIKAQHPDYYQRFDANKQYQQILFRAGKGLQSRELNDVQQQVNHQVKGVADALLRDGDIVSGGGVKVESGQARLAAASVYLRGAVRPIPETTLAFNNTEDALIGVFLDSTVVTELEDSQLRDPAGENSPMVHHNFDEPGAARLQVTGRWGMLAGAQNANTEFYPVYQINQGVLAVKEAPPQIDSITTALARYDRESNGGHYVVEGLGLHYIKTDNGAQHFSLQSGKAHIGGFELNYAMALPVTFKSEPDVQVIKAEKAPLQVGDDASKPIKVDFAPLKSVDRVSVEVRTTSTLTRTAQLKDSFAQTSVVKVDKVYVGDTVYVDGEDYDFIDNHISWRLDSQQERPPAGSSYQVTYVYARVVNVSHTQTHYQIDTAFLAPGDTILSDEIEADYQRLNPRIDLFVLNKQGEVKRIKGTSALEYPLPPAAPEQHLPLAYVYQQWGDSVPRIESVAIQAVSMLDLQNMQHQIRDLYQLLAIERLRNDANTQEPASKYGVFVDPFLDDDLRDQGLEQNAAIIDGELTLPVNPTVMALDSEQTQLLPYVLDDVLIQPKRTGAMKVNPYQAFEPVPAQVTLTPNVDHWTETRQRWSSPITRRFNRGSGLVQRIVTTVATQRVGVQTQQAEFLRSQTVHFNITGFGPEEELERVVFDGIELTAQEAS
ncbi:hypothetical protein PSECIP111951_01161 [Pseudoalteromonas holothuriae]|uniref:DUF4815 domain-containing protein n=1 Tax=Pseudoalteromonas holothuriae TaxID=2963714 RepID=A0ABM9GFV8_9GAMM|nr:DUF4815 domain-containing protein [Pseudoalteromonas sp. CIP111951]CAH9055047.1 hypothetical protein PSECIP111951_01161 [Pseudoalteromonas sp. CIP111951]